jgi:hypothetical protein
MTSHFVVMIYEFYVVGTTSFSIFPDYKGEPPSVHLNILFVHPSIVMRWLKGPIHDQSCCAKLFCATQVCPFTIKSISIIHDQSCCTTRNVAQHDWSCMGPLTCAHSKHQRWNIGHFLCLLPPLILCLLYLLDNVG